VLILLFIPLLFFCGAINCRLHLMKGDAVSPRMRFAYGLQGALSGAVLGAVWMGAVRLLLLNGSVLGCLLLVIKGVSLVTTMMSLLRNPTNAVHIFLGRYYFDEHLAHGFYQALTRFSWEWLQSWVGYNAAQVRNIVGNVSRVDFLAGSTFSVKEHSSNHMGISIGFSINMSIPTALTQGRKSMLRDQMFLHEYGHTVQSQLLGFLYLPVVGLPSLISCLRTKPILGDPYNAYTHGYTFTETWANRNASRYFSKHYGYEWNEYQGYPLHSHK